MTEHVSAPLSRTTVGMALMVLAVLSFSTMEVFVKTLAPVLDTVQILWARYLVQILAVTLIILPSFQSSIRTRHPWLQMFRSALVLTATAAFFIGYQRNSLVETNAIAQTAPIFITLGAAIFLGERFGLRRGISLVIGLIGALIVLQPGTPKFSVWLLFPLLGALGYSAYALATRYVGQTESVWTSAFYASSLSAIALSIAVPFFWQSLSMQQAGMLVAIGLLGTAAQLSLTKAFALTEASALAPISYVSLIFASFWDLAIFGVLPKSHTYLGALVIVGAGLYVWHRETRANT